MALKRLDYSVVEWPPPLQAIAQRMIFGRRTVPGLRIDGGEKVQGSRAIMRRLDQLAPEPRLLPEDRAERERIEEAERWGDEVFQPVGRELIWPAMVNRPEAMVSYSEHSRLPLPASAVRLSAPMIARLAARLNGADDDLARRDVEVLPTQLDKIDGWIADGRIGNAERPNAADLQIFSTVRLLMTLEDVRPIVEGRPCADAALALFPQIDGRMPAGALKLAA